MADLIENEVEDPSEDVAEVEDPGFKVVNSGTLNVAFHIYSNELREKLQGPDILRWNATIDDDEPEARKRRFNRLAVYGLMEEMVKNIGINQLRKVIVDTKTKGEYHIIYDAIEAELKTIQELTTQKFLVTSEIEYNEIPLVLGPGNTIIVDHETNKVAGTVISVDAKESMFRGKYLAVRMRILMVGSNGLAFGEVAHEIPMFAGVRSMGELGLSFGTAEEKAALIKRGTKYIKVVTEPAYMQYTGPITRRGWYGIRRSRGSGRVIVDYRSMNVMDPDYDEYYGKPQYHAPEEARNIDLTDENLLMICSPYVYGFSMSSKTWGEMSLANIEDINFRTDAFDKLELDARYKRMLNAQVTANETGFSGDIIDGKGGGLIYMLHGKPGIGKTLTAESIAEKLKRPLYSVSTGELGTDPDTLDERLKNILDMASAWNAILLIDEADIFLESRADGDVHRNAMVGIFLKLLEYYDGIMFLTTNRVKNIDVAFYSRISLAIRYPDLDVPKRTVIWTNLLAFYEYDVTINPAKLAEQELNGRQIKHIVRQASTLAKFEGHTMRIQDIEDVMDLSGEFLETIAGIEAD